MKGDRHALLVGINSYPLVEGADLDGCLNDVGLMHGLLVERFGYPRDNVATLTDSEASREAILSAMDDLAGRLGPEDVAVLFYAGHGSRMDDPRTPGRMLESMVAADSGRGTVANRDIVDEEVDRWVQRVNEITPNLHLVFDCCHSGSVTRDAFGGKTREMAPDRRRSDEMFGDDSLPPYLLASAGAAGEGRSGWSPGRRRAVLAAACRADEYACEHRYFDGQSVVRHGAMSFFLGETLAALDRPVTWRDVYQRMASKISAEYDAQHPQLEGRIDQVVFGVDEIRPARFLSLLSVDGDDVELSGGRAHGVAPGSVWSIRAFDAKSGQTGEELAQAEIVSLGSATSRARVAARSEGAELTRGLRAFVHRHACRGPGLDVAVDVPATEAGPADELRAALEASEMLGAVDGMEADILVRLLPPRDAVGDRDPCPGLGPLADWTWAPVGADGRLVAHCREADPGAIGDLIRDLEGVARYRDLLGIDNPSSTSALAGQVSLEVFALEDGDRRRLEADAAEGMAHVNEGAKIDYVVENRHDVPVWITIVEFGTDGQIELLLPRRRHPTYRLGGLRLEPGARASVVDYYRQDPRFAAAVAGGLPLQLPKAFPWTAERGEDRDSAVLTQKLFVTLEPADFEFVTQDAVRSDSRHPLQRLAARYAHGAPTRSAIPEAVAEDGGTDWTTVNLAVSLVRPQRGVVEEGARGVGAIDRGSSPRLASKVSLHSSQSNVLDQQPFGAEENAMGNRVGQFVSDLATDAGKLEAYRKSPDEAMKAAGLTEDERKVVGSGNWRAICEYFEPGGGKGRPLVFTQGGENDDDEPPP